MGKCRYKPENKQLLNQGEDNELELFGFRTQPCRRALCFIGYIFSLGFLKLLFYWKPEWDVWSQGVPCSLKDADIVLLQTTDAFKQCTKKKVTYLYLSALMKAQTGKEDQPIISEESSNVNRAIMKPHFKVRCLRVQKIRYVWDSSAQEFQKIGVLEDKYSCSELHSRFGAGFLSSEHTVRKKICGPNTIEVDIIPVWKLLFKEVLNPFYWFQVASISLWVSMGYYEYSGAIMIITLVSIVVTIHDLRQQSVKLHNLVEAHNSVVVTLCHKDGESQEIESRHLVPGDVFLLPGKKLYLPCDAILLNGSCIVDESMLTGESVPVSKIPLPNVDNSVPWKIHTQEDYKKHILFCGTKVLQTKASSVGPAKAVVLQTGFNTAKGDLVRSILYSKPVYGELYRDAKRFVMCLLVLGGIGMIYTAAVHSQLGTPTGEIVIYTLLIITVVIPPALPAGLAVGVMYSQKRLKKGGIYCISPQKITLCGWLNIVCFDKTGTLTEDGLDLWGVLPSIDRRFQEVHMFGSDTPLPWGPLLGAMASCHSLIMLDGKVQGDPLDLKMFEGTDWTLENVDAEHKNETSTDLIARPRLKAEKVPVEGVAVMRQFPFSSSLQRMSVVTRVIGPQGVMVFMKGAAEMVITFCKPETVPANFSSQLEFYTKQGFRVIGFAYKSLQMKPDFSEDVFSREEVESDLEFIGLLVMENRVKAETRPALKELSNADIKAVMVTGDNLQTAITVAKNSGMVAHGSRTVLVEAKGPEGSVPASLTMHLQERERSRDTNGDIAVKIDRKSNRKLEADEFHFAMSGASYQVITQHFSNMLPKLLLNGAIFARMSPRQKSSLIEEFQKLDYFVGMCGDGANDCGALKMAHAGISLSEQEASVASPFTSQTPNIECVPRLIKEGRAALVSSFCVFKYIMMNCLINFNCLMVLHLKQTFLSNYQYLTEDMGIAFITYLTITLNKAHPELCTRKPIRKIMSLPFVACMLIHCLLSLVVLVITFVVVQEQPWYSTTDVRSACLPDKERTFTNMGGNATQNVHTRYKMSFETTSLWIVTSFSYIIYAVVISKGKPFRKPLYTNYVHSILLTAQIVVFTFLMFTNNEAIQSKLEIVCTPLYWKLSLVIMLILYFIVAYAAEEYIVDNKDFWIALKRFLKIKTKSKYKILQRILEKDPEWPPLNVTQHAEKINGDRGSREDLL